MKATFEHGLNPKNTLPKYFRLPSQLHAPLLHFGWCFSRGCPQLRHRSVPWKRLWNSNTSVNILDNTALIAPLAASHDGVTLRGSKAAALNTAHVIVLGNSSIRRISAVFEAVMAPIYFRKSMFDWQTGKQFTRLVFRILWYKRNTCFHGRKLFDIRSLVKHYYFEPSVNIKF